MRRSGLVVPPDQLLLKSRQRALVAWILAGPLNPVWLVAVIFNAGPWLSNLSLQGLFGLWLFTGLPSTVGVSIGFLLYRRLNTKSAQDMYLLVLKSIGITILLAILGFLFWTYTIVAPDASPETAAGFMLLYIGLIFGLLIGAPCAVLAYVIVRLIAVKSVPQPAFVPTAEPGRT